MTPRTLRRPLSMALAAALTLALAGCARGAEPNAGGGAAVEPRTVRVGTLPTEDALPLWAAEAEGVFEEVGLPSVEIVTFQSAQERDAALVAGEIDAFMGDMIAAAQLEAGGTPVAVEFVMLGATPEEGRFGILAAPGSEVDGLQDLAGVPVGTSSGTIQEYVLDGLMRQAGVPAERVVKEEVKKVPVRFELLMNGKLAAAALPEPLLSLGEMQGAKLIADDTSGENLSQTVLVASEAFLRAEGGLEAMELLVRAWDAGAELVNGDPDAWRETLVDKARLPEPLRDTYRVNAYPAAQPPTEEQVAAVLEWMRAEGTLKADLTPLDLSGVVTPGDR
ncbi:MAG: ABC transporter substrate-binding protein [Coriobacteriia bacterium]|nr:ABC transporter substrate-binding protein [Coriobacteriia bacterium]